MKHFLRKLSELISLLLLSALLPSLHAELVISEFMASNHEALADEDGDFPDWIEIYNNGPQSVDADGWYLTDDADQLTQWRLPAVTIAANDFLLVFASGKDRAQAGQPLHANFSLNAGGEYLGLVRPDGTTIASEYAPQFPEQFRDISYGVSQEVQTNRFLAAGDTGRWHVPQDDSLGQTWLSPNFDDASWSTGPTGLGYETAVPGFAVRYIKANVTVGGLAAAESVAADPDQQSSVTVENSAVIDYYGTGGEGHYTGNTPFPGTSPGVDIDDFVADITATITIPEAGPWTFGVNSDDGFRLDIGNFDISWPDPRGPADTLGVFNVPAAGDYELHLIYYERGGGSEVELFAAQGNHSSWNSSDFSLVGDTGNGGLAVRSLPVGAGEPSGNSGGSLRSLITTDVESEMKDQNASLYLRMPFEMTAVDEVDSLTLRMQYNDGFVAYLNGQEVAHRHAPTEPSWNSTATESHPTHLSLAFESINLTDHLSALREGVNVLAFHGLNRSAEDTEFLVRPELVEYRAQGLAAHYFSEASPGSFNGSGFLAFVGDTQFSVDRGFYTEPFPVTISTETPDAEIRYTTNGIPPTATTGFVYTEPVQINATTTLRAAAYKEGFEPSNVDTHTYIFLDDVIHQSLDGRAPSGWPSSWGGNTVDYGMDPEIVNDPRYRDTIKDDLKTIPSFSIVTDLDHLFDPSTGIYANPGQDGRQWERPISLELIYPDGTKGFQVNAGLRIRGGFSRSTGNPKHAFRLFFRSEYGPTKLRFPMFGEDGADSFDGFDLRTFQNYSWSFQGDSRNLMLRDQFSRDTQRAMGHQAERGDYYHLYINGQYWGLFNTDERPEASFGESYFGGDKEDYDTIKVESGPYTINATDGNMEAWTQLWDLSRNGLSSNAAYERVQGNNPDGTPNPDYPDLVEVPNLIDYMLVILYGGNLDAPISNFLGNTRPNNWFGVRNQNGPDGFRFFVHDAEHTLLNVNEDRTGPYPAGDQLQYSNPQWVWQQMWENPEFKILMADHIHRHFFNGGILTPESVRQRLLKRKDEIDRAVVGESARWGDAKRSTPFTREDWMAQVNNTLQNIFPQRSSIVLNQLRSKDLYPDVTAPSFNRHGGNVDPGFSLSMNAPDGMIYYTLDGSDPRLRGGAVSPTAQTYSESIALNENTVVKARVRDGQTWSALNEAAFIMIRTFTELRLTELMYHPAAGDGLDGDEFEFIEFKNVGADELDLSGVHFTDGIRFTFPNGTLLEPGAFVVLVNNPTAFAQRYPDVPITGTYSGQLDNGGETVTLVHAAGDPLLSFTYDDEEPWPISADGPGFALVPIDPAGNLDLNDPAHWRAGGQTGGSPGSDDVSGQIPNVWINEILTHTDPPQLDAIELHNPTAEPADVSHWFLTDDRQVPKKFQIPPDTVVGSGEFVVFTETEFNPVPGSDSSFNLSSHGEEAYLYSGDSNGNLTGYSHGFSFGAAANGVSFGRYTTSTGQAQYPAQSEETLGSANSGPAIGPVVINEIQYHPVAGEVEFVELKNVTDSAVSLFDPENPSNTWQVNGIDWTFPENVELPPNGLLLLVSGDPDSFRSRQSIPSEVPVFGPFAGVLQNGGERLQLLRPDLPDVDPEGQTIVPYIVVDEVRYDNQTPWPIGPDGTGPSLERIKAAAYGNDPVNWRASPGPASPGLDNSGNRRPIVNAGPDQQLVTDQFPFGVTLTGSAEDDGLPAPPAGLTGNWRFIDGPGIVFFEPDGPFAATAFFPGTGTYQLRLEVSDGEFQGSDDVTITIERPSSEAAFVPVGSVWKYLDDGSDQGAAWRTVDFDDDGWESGPAQLGYGDGDVETVVNSGPENDKFITTYFRHAFEIGNPDAVTALTLNLVRDDGAIVYLNNQEVFRSNMPAGEVTYQTTAASVVGSADESAFQQTEVDPARLQVGVNVLAVEIHQISGTSSDISFDLELAGMVFPQDQPPTVDAGEDRTVALSDSLLLEGEISDDGLPNPPGQMAIQWEQIDGPGTATFAQPGWIKTDVAFDQPGTYQLRLTGDDGATAISDDLSVTVEGESEDFESWRTQYFNQSELEDPAVSGRDADPDGDGHTNDEEFQAGTHPREANSYLHIEMIERSPDTGTVRFLFQAMPGRSYSVQYRNALTEGTWNTLEDIAANAETRQVEVQDPGSDANGIRYYRIVTPQQP